MSVEIFVLGDVLSEVVAAVQSIPGFAVEGRVQKGWFAAPPVDVPFACVSAPEVETAEGQARSDLWQRTARLRVRAWTAFTTDTQDSRVTSEVDLVESLLSAIEDRYATAELFSNADDVVARTATPDPVVAEAAASFVFAEITIEVRYRRVAGT